MAKVGGGNQEISYVPPGMMYSLALTLGFLYELSLKLKFVLQLTNREVWRKEEKNPSFLWPEL